MFIRVHSESKAACVAGSRVFHGEFGFLAYQSATWMLSRDVAWNSRIYSLLGVGIRRLAF